MLQTRGKVLISVAGVLIGAINGFFGGGGGMICVPILLWAGLCNQNAQATAILIMLPISIASAVVYYTQGFVEWECVLFVTLGSIVGGVLGAYLLKILPNKALKFVFAIVVISAGVKMLF